MNTTRDDSLSELVPNLDAFCLPREAAEQRALFKQWSSDFAKLASYCEAKENAMCARLNGKIELARKFEAACEVTYAKLPLWARW